MKKSAGIDFGTTNSSAAIAQNGQEPHLVKLEKEFTTIPTALYFSEYNDDVFFGRDAQIRYTNDENTGRFMRSIKRLLGTSLMNSAGTQIGTNLVKFDIIIECFIKHLKNKIDTTAGESVENVIMGRPVHFHDNDPSGDAAAENELRKIALNAGFKNIVFQFEPIAAAFAHEQLLSSEKLAAVIDIGGGTSDFTIIKLSPEHKNLSDRTNDILANTGVRIGGNDFDKSLALKSFMPEFGLGSELGGRGKHNQILPMPNTPYFNLATWSSVNDLYTLKSLNNISDWLFQSRSPEKLNRLSEIAIKRLGHTNLDYVENAKIQLSDKEELKIILDFLIDKPTVSASRNDFESAILNNVNKIKKSIEDCIKLSGTKNEDITLVILTGGSTEIPYISDIMRSYFPNAELSTSNKLSSVGLGLAYDSLRCF